MKITPAQLKRLQVLYTQYERHSLDCPGADRAARMRWASEATGRQIDSFSDLTLDEATRLIDGLQRTLGTKAPNKSPRRRLTRHDAQKKGTEGRHDQIHNERTIAGPSEFAMLQRDIDRLGWDQARLDAFLRGPHNPMKSRRSAVQTLGDANNVHWALIRFIRSGKEKQTIA